MPTPTPAPWQEDKRALTVSKLMVALSWAGGHLRHPDVEVIQQYLFSNGQPTEDELHAFDLYLEYPVDSMERRRLARRYAQKHPSPQDAKFAITQLESLLPANPEDDLEKLIALQEVKEALVEDRITFLKKVRYRITRTPFPAKIRDSGREAYLEEYRANPIFFRLKLRCGEEYHRLGLTERKAERLCLAMGLASLIIYADQILLPEELNALSDYVREESSLDEQQIELLVTMALCREAKPDQVEVFCRRYRELSTFEERQRLYLRLGKIAQADHVVTKSERHVLEQIANAFEIPPGVRRSALPDMDMD